MCTDLPVNVCIKKRIRFKLDKTHLRICDNGRVLNKRKKERKEKNHAIKVTLNSSNQCDGRKRIGNALISFRASSVRKLSAEDRVVEGNEL